MLKKVQFVAGAAKSASFKKRATHVSMRRVEYVSHHLWSTALLRDLHATFGRNTPDAISQNHANLRVLSFESC